MDMTIDMAREAGMTVVDDEYSLLPFLERFEALVRADEREACAMLAWSEVLAMTDVDTADKVLSAIRVRSST